MYRSFLILLALTSGVCAQSSRLIKHGAPAPATLTGYDRAHCVTLPQQMRVCKTLSDEKDTFIFERNGKTVGTWPGNVYLAETSDFEVMTGDLDNDKKTELIVANHDGTSNGLGVDYWTIFILPDSAFRDFRRPLTFSVEEYGSFGTFITSGGRVNILTTSWVWNKDPKGKRGWGTYLVGQWWRYRSGEIQPLADRPIIARRYLARFERERMNTVKLDRIPFQWLSDPSTEPINTAFITKKGVTRLPGVIREVSTETTVGTLRILFKPAGADPITLIYTLDEGPSRLDYFGDTASGRLYPKHYLPSQPAQWLKHKRATLRSYQDGGLHVLWLDH